MRRPRYKNLSLITRKVIVTSYFVKADQHIYSSYIHAPLGGRGTRNIDGVQTETGDVTDLSRLTANDPRTTRRAAAVVVLVVVDDCAADEASVDIVGV